MIALRTRFREYRIYFLVYLFIIAIIVAIAVILTTFLKKSLINGTKERLEYISRYKSEEISNWMREREGDAAVIVGSHNFPSELNALLDDPKNKEKYKGVIAHFIPSQRYYGYEDVILTDLEGRLFANIENPRDSFGPDSKNAIKQSLKKNNLLFSDFYYCREHKRIHIDFYAPVYGHPGDSSTPRALVLLRVNPELFIYPLLKSWPVPSPTSEALLVGTENDSIIYLNELRNQKGTALKLKFPISDPDLPAAMAARGMEGLVKGKDYRGIDVLSIIRHINGTPWFLVVKTDSAEVFQPLLVWSIEAGVSALFLILLSGTIILIIINRHRKEHFQNLYELQVEKEALAKLQEIEIQKLNAELEKRVLERTAQLKAANEELESFSYSVSHDLRAPLRSMDGFSQALLEDYTNVLDDNGKRYLNRIRLASQKMAQLIDDLLKLSRISRLKLKMERIDLSKLGRSICNEISGEFSDISYDVKIEHMMVSFGDPSLMRICLTNLLHNAFKFSHHSPAPQIEFGATAKDGSQVFYIRDNGAGFDITHGNKLFGVFQRFHTVDEFPGNGVGLTIVQRIIHRHNGLIWATSEIGQGSTFFFTLPLMMLDKP